MAERKIPITFYDDKQLCCPQVGHDVAFEYCRTQQGDGPCRNLLSCWWDHIEIASFVAQHFGGPNICDLFDGPPEKVASLVELINQASGGEPS